MKHLLLTCFCVTAVWLGSASSAIAQDLRIGLWEGEFSSTFDKSILEAWRSETGRNTVIETNSDILNRLHAAGANGDAVWDVVTISGAQERALCDAGSIKPLAQELQEFTDHLTTSANCGVPYLAFGQTISFIKTDDTDPSGALDFFDEAIFPGKRGLSTSPRGTLEMALLADGVDPNDIYSTLSSTEGVERALAKLDTIKPNIVWWNNSHQAIEMLTDGEVVLSTTWSSTINDAFDRGVDLATTSEFMMVEYDFLAVPSASTQADQAKEFVAYATNRDGLQRIYDGYSGKYSVPWNGVTEREDPIFVQACVRGTCPCAGGGCAKDCCESDDGFGGHFEIDEAFWNEHFVDISKTFDIWRGQQ